MILGTAGHVDHGKTSLVHALTGVNTDSLPEEKRRGLTIEPGFAHLKLSNGEVVSVVDVPGHEKFVRSMAAQAGGLDAVLFVIAADEGIMPQTREHLAICQLLGMKRGIVALTKIDVAQPLGEEYMALVESDVRAFTQGTFLEAAPLLLVSVRSMVGLDALKEAIEHLVKESTTSAQASVEKPLYLPLDRVFSVAGFGTVVTGTLCAGTLKVDDAIAIAPGGEEARVRGLQVHGQAVCEAKQGTRVAVNLSHPAGAAKGCVLLRPAEFVLTRRLDVQISALPGQSQSWPKRRRLFVSLGTQVYEASVRLLSGSFDAAETAFAQILFEAPVAAFAGQHFVLRSNITTGSYTMGGGVVLALGGPRRRNDEWSRQLFGSTDLKRAVLVAEAAGFRGLTDAALALALNQREGAVRAVVEQLLASQKLVRFDRETPRCIAAVHWARLSRKMLFFVQQFHDKHPELTGISKEELRQKLGNLPEKAFHKLLLEQSKLESHEAVVRLRAQTVELSQDLTSAMQQLLQLLNDAGLAPPHAEELPQKANLTRALGLAALAALGREKKVLRAGDFYFSAQSVRVLETKLLRHFESFPTLDTQQFKELVQQSRKFMIPLAEYFDREQVTLRVGDVRRLKKKVL
jgi:selenocysteine-specific elongation factor